MEWSGHAKQLSVPEASLYLPATQRTQMPNASVVPVAVTTLLMNPSYPSMPPQSEAASGSAGETVFGGQATHNSVPWSPLKVLAAHCEQLPDALLVPVIVPEKPASQMQSEAVFEPVGLIALPGQLVQDTDAPRPALKWLAAHRVQDPLATSVPVIVPVYPATHRQSLAASRPYWLFASVLVEESVGQDVHCAVPMVFLNLPLMQGSQRPWANDSPSTVPSNPATHKHCDASVRVVRELPSGAYVPE